MVFASRVLLDFGVWFISTGGRLLHILDSAKAPPK
jgi:hypothetical protein